MILGAVGSLCNIVKFQGRGEILHLRPKNIYIKIFKKYIKTFKLVLRSFNFNCCMFLELVSGCQDLPVRLYPRPHGSRVHQSSQHRKVTNSFNCLNIIEYFVGALLGLDPGD